MAQHWFSIASTKVLLKLLLSFRIDIMKVTFRLLILLILLMISLFNSFYPNITLAIKRLKINLRITSLSLFKCCCLKNSMVVTIDFSLMTSYFLLHFYLQVNIIITSSINFRLLINSMFRSYVSIKFFAINTELKLLRYSFNVIKWL